MTLMQKAISRDGSEISFRVTGTGAPLVLVHGTGGSLARWAPILPKLEEKFTLYAVDRRGRGESFEKPPYAIEREFEDVVAVVDSIGKPANVLGHSYGGICAVEAALLTDRIRKLVLYEPPIPNPADPLYAPAMIDSLQTLLDAGDREAVLSAFFHEVVRMPSVEFVRMKSAPSWPGRLAAAHTLPRELKAHNGYRFRGERFRSMAVPTLLLLGSESPVFFRSAIGTLASALPHNEIVELKGQKHIAIDTAPALFAAEVIQFLDRD